MGDADKAGFHGSKPGSFPKQPGQLTGFGVGFGIAGAATDKQQHRFRPWDLLRLGSQQSGQSLPQQLQDLDPDPQRPAVVDAQLRVEGLQTIQLHRHVELVVARPKKQQRQGHDLLPPLGQALFHPLGNTGLG
jgi:hypothetical protein